MHEAHRLLVINVGSTSTKVAWFKGNDPIALETIRYSGEDLARYSSMDEQLPRREKDLLDFLKKNGIALEEADIIVSRGGLGRPLPAGAYEIDDAMCGDLLEGRFGKHPSALGPAMASDLSRRYGVPAVVIDPPSTDEFQPLARFSGLPEIERKSALHALNQKAAARRLSVELGREYEGMNLIVAHLGGGITVGAHQQGRVVDCTHGLGEGPFTPERAGSLPTTDLLELAFSGKLDKTQILRRLVGQGGLFAYVGTSDVQKVEEMITAGDEKAKLVYEAMAYQVAKEIGAMSVVLKGEIDGVILTGGLANSEMMTGLIREWIQFIAPVFVYPGEDEMAALAEGGLRVLRQEEKLKKYSSGAMDRG
ncbi:MAG TPA: butyrate kinase [Syntrophobacteria bacterium]|nr:butyrate kinase [Syntrophobacteria bacterium]